MGTKNVKLTVERKNAILDRAISANPTNVQLKLHRLKLLGESKERVPVHVVSHLSFKKSLPHNDSVSSDLHVFNSRHFTVFPIFNHVMYSFC